MSNNLDMAIRHSAVVCHQDIVNVCGREVTVSTVWLPAPWYTHETAIYWGESQFHVVATNAGSHDAYCAHLHWSCYPTLSAFVMSKS